MKGVTTWSFQPYKPFLFDTGDIYICRIYPGEGKIGFDWLPLEDTENYTVHLRKRVSDGTTDETYTEHITTDTSFLFKDLEDDTD